MKNIFRLDAATACCNGREGLRDPQGTTRRGTNEGRPLTYLPSAARNTDHLPAFSTSGKNGQTGWEKFGKCV